MTTIDGPGDHLFCDGRSGGTISFDHGRSGRTVHSMTVHCVHLYFRRGHHEVLLFVKKCIIVY